MYQKTFEHKLRKLVRRSPFKTFKIELASGERIVVDQPEALAFQSGVAGYVSQMGEVSIFDHEDVSRITD